jgi:cyanate lyase
VTEREALWAKVDDRRQAAGLTWRAVAEHVGGDAVFVTAALMGQHPLSLEQAQRAAELLELSAQDAVQLTRVPAARIGDRLEIPADPTLYRFYEALGVYGPAIRALIHEEFGDGIMSAINFNLQVSRVPDPEGDRVHVVFDGKFLKYQW